MPSPAQDLSDEALDWIIRLHSGAASAADWQAWGLWRAQGDAFEAAAAEAERLWQGLGAAGHQIQSRRVSRRAILGGGAAAVVLGAGLVQAGVLRWPREPDFHTATAERRAFTLPDGTGVAMNARTGVNVVQDGIALVSGQATFEAGQTVTLHVAGATVTCAGGRVDVDLQRNGAAITCLSGEVAVQARGARTALGQNERLFTASLRREGVDPDDVLAWQRGKLIVSDCPLADLAFSLQRYSPNKIAVLGDSVGAMAVTGVFNLNNPADIWAGLQGALPIRVTQIPFLTVIRAA